MTGVNIREENHIHESIWFGFPGGIGNAIIITVCYTLNIISI